MNSVCLIAKLGVLRSVVLVDGFGDFLVQELE